MTKKKGSNKLILRKKIKLDLIAGVTKSLTSDELVIHIRKDFDYWLVYEWKDELIDCIKMAYISSCKKNLNIFGVKQKELSKYTTSEKDVEKGKSRMPD